MAERDSQLILRAHALTADIVVRIRIDIHFGDACEWRTNCKIVVAPTSLNAARLRVGEKGWKRNTDREERRSSKPGESMREISNYFGEWSRYLITEDQQSPEGLAGY